MSSPSSLSLRTWRKHYSTSKTSDQSRQRPFHFADKFLAENVAPTWVVFDEAVLFRSYLYISITATSNRLVRKLKYLLSLPAFCQIRRKIWTKRAPAPVLMRSRNTWVFFYTNKQDIWHDSQNSSSIPNTTRQESLVYFTMFRNGDFLKESLPELLIFNL